MQPSHSHPVLPSPDTTAICPHFGICGGCATQDITYPKQVAAKEAWLASLFDELISNKGELLPFLASQKKYPTYFRNKTRFSFVREGGVLRAARHRVGEDEAEVAVSECYIMSATSTAIATFTAEYGQRKGWELFDPKTSKGWLKHLLIREGKMTGETLVSLVTTESGPDKAEAWAQALLTHFPGLTSVYQSVTRGRNNFEPVDRLLAGQDAIHERIGDHVFRISPHAFFQTNSEMVGQLYGAIHDQVAKRKPTNLWDLYAGSASIGIFVSDVAAKVTSIESNAQNISDAGWNIERNNVRNLTMAAGTVEEVCTSTFVGEQGRPDMIVVDPPRAGLSERSRDLISGLRPQTLVYVSCNPLTCLRDSRELTKRGYALRTIQGVDMYPHTLHCEMVATFERA